MLNTITVNIERKSATSIQQSISEPTIKGNEVNVVCYDNSTDLDVLISVMYAIDSSDLIESIYDEGHKDAIVNGKVWSLSNSEFRN